MESKNDKFRRIATKRTNEILDKIRVLSNCSNRTSYDYDQEDVRKIFGAIESQLKITKAKFTERNDEFKL